MSAASEPSLSWQLKSADGTEHELLLAPGHSLSLGRDLTCDIVLLDASVSRHHATLSIEESAPWIEDLHSQNGTFVNSKRVNRVELHPGDIVTAGRVHLSVHQHSRREVAKPRGLPDLPRSDTLALLEISRRCGETLDTTTLLQRALELAQDRVAARSMLAMTWNVSRSRFEMFAGIDSDGCRVPLDRSPLDERVLESTSTDRTFTTGIVTLDRDPRTHTPLDTAWTVVPVEKAGERVGILVVDLCDTLDPSTRAFLDTLAWVLAPHWFRRAQATENSALRAMPSPRATVALEAARRDVGNRDTGSWEPTPARLFPRTTDEDDDPDEEHGGPDRLLALLETQLGRLRNRLVDEERIDTRRHDDLVEASLLTRAIGVLCTAQRPARRRIDLAGSVLQALDSTTLVADSLTIDPSHLESVERVEADVPSEIVGLLLELLLCAASRWKDPRNDGKTAVRVCLSADRPAALAQLKLEIDVGEDDEPFSEQSWNDQDPALVAGRRLACLFDGSLCVAPLDRELSLLLPLADSISSETSAQRS